MTQSLPDMLLRRAGSRGPKRVSPEQSARRTKRQTAAALAGVPLFAGISKRHLHLLAGATDEMDYSAGQAIVREGDLGEVLFVVLTGEGKVVRGKRTVAKVRPGDFFGELAAILGGARTASVVAETDMRVLRLFRRTLNELTSQDPSLTVALLDGIVRRLRQVERAGAASLND